MVTHHIRSQNTFPMPRSQKLFGAESAKAYAGAGGLTWYFAVKPKPPMPPLGRGRSRPSKKRKTQCPSQHVRRGRIAGSTCGKYFIQKKDAHQLGKRKAPWFAGEGHSRLAQNNGWQHQKQMSRGVINVTILQRIMDPPSNILCTSNRLLHTVWVKDLAAKQMVDKWRCWICQVCSRSCWSGKRWPVVQRGSWYDPRTPAWPHKRRHMKADTSLRLACEFSTVGDEGMQAKGSSNYQRQDEY